MPRKRRFEKGQAKAERAAAQTAQLEELKVSYISRDQLKPNDYNPNRQSEHEFELLCRSMREDGFTQPILAAEDLTIVDGYHRWRAAGEVGIEQVPVVVMPMPAAQARIATLRHNRARGSEDLDLSAAVLRDLQRLGALDWAAESLMLSETEVQRLVQIPEVEDLEELSDLGLEEGRRASSDMSPAALKQAREAEQRAARADQQREAESWREQPQPWRLRLTYTGEEAQVVRAVLGDRPAGTLLWLCEAERQRRS